MAENLLQALNTTIWWLNENDSVIENGNQSIFASTADPAFVHFRDESRFWVQRVSCCQETLCFQYRVFFFIYSTLFWVLFDLMHCAIILVDKIENVSCSISGTGRHLNHIANGRC